ncbi:hypothetical protein [uncultured Shewanella sp.]|uniref:hypothetical protein n=1 Tax=uncultured Shewanella sp. TaxID=173975 RepID=UPI00261D964D|nr:hypothetical protein [uncultured Shewanella sp.]
MKNYLHKVNWISVIGMLLASATLHLLLLQIYTHHFTVNGIKTYLSLLISTNKAPDIWNHLLTYLLHFPLLIIIVFTLVMLVSVLGLFFSSKPVFPLLTSALYGGLWLSNLGRAESWLFEFLLPSLFALIIAIAQWDQQLNSNTQSNWLGYKRLPTQNNKLNVFITVILLILLSYFNFLSQNGKEHVVAVTVLFSILTALATYTSLTLDNDRKELESSNLVRTQRTYLFLIASSIGLMLIYQVNEDIALNWFTSEGYQNLVKIFQKTSNAPEMIISFLAHSASISSILAPTQFIFESFAAFCLFIGVLRVPMYWLTSGLLGLLMLIEFGAPASWPPTPTSPVNWVWELMLPTFVLIICSIHATVEFLESKNLRQLILGNQLFSDMSLSTKALFSITLFGILSIAIVQSTHPEISETVLSKTLLISISLFIVMFVFDNHRKN